MSRVTHDTLDLVDSLKKAGTPPDQAEAIVKAISQAQNRLVTEDILERRLAPVRSDLLVLKWMMAIVIAVTVIPALTKLFSL